MKKISLFVVALGSCLAMFAQNTTTSSSMVTPMARKTYWGLKAGVNLAEFRVHNDPTITNLNMKTSLNGGLFVNIPLGTKFQFQPEVIYSGQGSKYNQNNVAYEQDLSYIALPLMFQVRSAGGFFVELGPQPAYLVRAELEQGDTHTKNMSQFDRFDLGLNGGLGYVSRVGLGVNARYTLGLTNTMEDGGGNNSPNNGPEMKNSVIQFSLFYMFGAHK